MSVPKLWREKPPTLLQLYRRSRKSYCWWFLYYDQPLKPAETLNFTRHIALSKGQSNMPSASGQPLPSATAAELQQLVTPSHSHHLSQKVCLFTKPRRTRHLPSRRVQSLSRVIWARQWKMKAQTEARAVKHVSGWCSHRPSIRQVEEKTAKKRAKRQGQGGRGLSLGQGWANFILVWYTLICTLHLSPDCECKGRWAGTCRTLYGMRRLFINH